MEHTALYAGTFDPLTNGHLWMIEQGASLFSRLTVAIGVNARKRPLFSLEDRLTMLRNAVSHLPNVTVSHFENQYLIRHAERINARFILRGIRDGKDYEYERAMRNINGDLNDAVTTICLMPPRSMAEISSSTVKELIGPDGWEDVVKQYVPFAVFEQLTEAHRAGR
jgi:pantetheine-phosphate adenylyltransferase